jgi:signal-transduction protein with cAMP-binding, CBS, and nucleotidyltransferase domain
MFDPSDIHRSSETRLPAWLARDLGLHPSTRLANAKGSSTRRGLKRFVRSPRYPRADEVMAAIPLFEGLSKRERLLASQLSTTVAVPAGAMLTQEGADGAEFFVVLEGQVEVFQGGHVIATRGPGSPLGEMALLEGGPRTATLLAKTPVSTLVSGRQEFNNLLTAIPRISERLRAITAERRAA